MDCRIAAAALALAFGITSCRAPPTQDLTGEWVSVATDDTPFPLIMHVDHEIRLDSPDRGLFGVLGEARQNGSQVDIVFANGAAFEGHLQGDLLTGDYFRGPAALPLAFQRKRSWLSRLTG